jgi:hypothetical protein
MAVGSGVLTDAHRGDGKRFVVRADEKLTAFIELESAVHERQGTLKADSYTKSASLPFPVPLEKSIDIVCQRRAGLHPR